jgi:hypothetical protein
MATGVRQSRFPVNSLGRRGCRGNAWHSPFHAGGGPRLIRLGAVGSGKYACLPALRTRTHLLRWGRARCPGVLSKIEFGRMPVTLVIAVEPERGQIL